MTGERHEPLRPPGPGPGSPEAFRARIADALGLAPGELWAGDTPLGDAGLDEVALFQVVMTAQLLNPWFQLPDQLDARDATLDDLHHLCTVMGEGHHQESDR